MDSKWYINGRGETVNIGENLVKVDVGYSKGGVNYFNSENEDRGYYVHVSFGVNRKEIAENLISESLAIFNGFKVCIRPVKRASDKALQQTSEKVARVIGRISEIVRGEGDETSKSNAIGSLLLGLKEAA